MEQTSATMLEAITVTSLSRRIWALVCSAMISRNRRKSRRGPPTATVINQPRLFQLYYSRRTAGRKTTRPHFSWPMLQYVSGSVQLIGGMQRPHRQLDIFLGDQDADLDL